MMSVGLKRSFLQSGRLCPGQVGNNDYDLKKIVHKTFWKSPYEGFIKHYKNLQLMEVI